MERLIEMLMYRSRWLLAPIYFGLSVALLVLGVKFFQEAVHLITYVFTSSESDMVLGILSLIDMAMVGGLIVMVMMSGYENFVSQINVAEGDEKLSWLGTMDASSLKMKIAASIVAISSIHLLKMFMNVPTILAKDAAQAMVWGPGHKEMFWYVTIHMVFVASAFAMGYLDRLTKH